MVRRGNPKGVLELRDLCGRDVAVEKGTVQVDLLEPRAGPLRRRQPIRVRTYADNAQALLQVRTGRADARCSATTRRPSSWSPAPAPAATTSSPPTRSTSRACTASPSPRTPGTLRDALRGALERVMASGEYADVLERHDVRDGLVPQPSVNGGAQG